MPRLLQGHQDKLSFKRKLRSEMTPSENKLWLKLRMRQVNDLKFRRQHGVGPYIVDFYCSDKRIVIEVDGDVHASDDQERRDKERQDYLEKLGVRVIRYQNDHILNNLESVMEDLYRKLDL